MPEKVRGERCPKTQRKEAPAAEEMDKCCGGRLQPSFFPPSLLLFYYAFRLYGFTCVCVFSLRHRYQTDCLTAPYLGGLGLHWTCLNI